ncbi:MAG: FAD-binding oxidoreductase [Cohaesibacteraceae bacterium]
MSAALDFDRDQYDLDGFRKLVSGVRILDDPVTLKRRSRDYFWFSPIAKEALDGKLADLVAVPQSVDEVKAIASAAARLRIPVTMRGLGTGTYGQAVPLHGGVVLDTTELTGILHVGPDGFTAQAGAKVAAVEDAARAQGLELRMHPSTKKMATIGGYFCGGSGGIGSVTWGGLREEGNLHGARVITLEEEPQEIALKGLDTNLVNRTFGSTGIVVEVSAPLESARLWQDVVAVFDGFDEALAFGHQVAAADDIAKRLVSFHAPASAHFLRPLIPGLEEGQCAVLMMVDQKDLDRLDAGSGSIILSEASDAREADPARLPIYEMSWGHTTLHAIKQDRSISYLQTLFPPGRIIETATQMHRALGDELPLHMEFIRYEGDLAANGAQLWTYSSKQRLAEIIALHEDHGIPVANPHVFNVEDGSRHKRVPGDQLAFKARVDPYGLLNPGKMPSYVPVRA